MTGQTLLLLLLFFQVKHLLADFVLQSAWIVRNKGIYGHPGGLVHAGLHAGLSFVVMLFSPLTAATVLAIALSEMVLHYHIDWTKDRLLRRMNTNPSEWRYWVLTGADQFAHQVTYVAMLWLMLKLV